METRLMEAILIDRNFEFMPQNMSNRVRASIGVVCETEEQLLFLLQHLNSFNLSNEYNKSLAQKNVDNVSPPKSKPKEEIDEALKTFMENAPSNTIAGLEIN